MTQEMHDLKRGDCLSPSNPALLRQPLDFINEDHLRERQVCVLLDRVAEAASRDDEAIACILAFLHKELPLHLEDEEQDLFPLLRRRCEPEDEIGKVIDRLTRDHDHAGVDTPLVIRDLQGLAAGQDAAPPQMRDRLKRYAAHARRHLILENAIILPFARLRLTRRDLETLRLRMVQRRGLDPLPETPHAD